MKYWFIEILRKKAGIAIFSLCLFSVATLTTLAVAKSAPSPKKVTQASVKKTPLIPQGLPESQRIAIYGKIFNPPPGEEATIEPSAIRDFDGSTGDVAKLRGYIDVKLPTKDDCIIIRRFWNTRDQRVCGSARVTFKLEEVDYGGRVKWRVFTAENDDGTDLVWQTPHRIALAIPAEVKLPAESHPIFIEKCDAYNYPGDRRMELRLFDKTIWTIRLPDEDKHGDQPPTPPNLDYVETHAFEIVSKDKTTKKEGDPKKPDDHADAKKMEDHVVTDSEINPFAKKEKKIVYNLPWRIWPFGFYTMSSGNFKMAGNLPPGMLGECRYHFLYPREFTIGGAMECHFADQYAYAWVPLACSGVFQPTVQGK